MCFEKIRDRFFFLAKAAAKRYDYVHTVHRRFNAAMQYLFKQQSTAKGAFLWSIFMFCPRDTSPRWIFITQLAIKQAKDDFEEALAAQLNLPTRFRAAFVDKSTGLNDDLNGVERPVEFDLLERSPASRCRWCSRLQNGSAMRWAARLPAGALHRHERHPPRQRRPITSTRSMSTSGTGEKVIAARTATLNPQGYRAPHPRALLHLPAPARLFTKWTCSCPKK